MSDSPLPPLYDDDEREPVTGILDVPPHLRKWAESQSRRVRRLERHFVDEGDGKRGMVAQLAHDFRTFMVKHDTERGLLGKLPTILAVIALVLTWAGGAVALYVHAQNQPQPAPALDAQDVAKQIVKLQQQK